MVSQQRIARAQRHVERVVAVGWRHDVGSCIFAEGAQGRSVGADVGLNSCHGGGRLFEGRTPDRERRFAHVTVMGGTRGSLRRKESVWD